MGLAEITQELEHIHGLRGRWIHKLRCQDLGIYKQVFPDEESGIWNLFFKNSPYSFQVAEKSEDFFSTVQQKFLFTNNYKFPSMPPKISWQKCKSNTQI